MLAAKANAGNQLRGVAREPKVQELSSLFCIIFFLFMFCGQN
jgi:hypothetical protein